MIATYVRLRATLPIHADEGMAWMPALGADIWAATGSTAEDAVAALLQDLQRAGFATALTSGPDLPGQGVLEL